MDLLKSAGDNILFTGVLSNNKLYDIVSQALALVLPTHYEGFGIPPLESLYLGEMLLLQIYQYYGRCIRNFRWFSLKMVI